MWPGVRTGPSKSAQKPSAVGTRGHSYSFHNQSIDEGKAIAIEDGGPGEGARLLQEVLSTLGETDPTTFRGVLDHFPAAAIRAALERVRATPPEKLRKSRTALFRYLLSPPGVAVR
jgi:hypothetical protein